MSMPIWVCGEALYDLLPVKVEGQTLYRPVPGGSPFNVAIGVARLGSPVAFIGSLSTDPNGEALLACLHDEGVETTSVQQHPYPSALAYVFEPLAGAADVRYSFYIDGTSEVQLNAEQALATMGAGVHFHIGSFSAVRAPNAQVIAQLCTEAKRRMSISYDLNARPSITLDPQSVRAVAHSRLAQADIIKVSDEDIAWLYPDTSATDLAQRWLELGAQVVLLTRGADGVDVFQPHRQYHCPTQPVDIVDTVGAGDSFMAAFLDGAYRAALLGPQRALQEANLKDIVTRAQHAAAMTCARQGANPPTYAELESR